MNETKGTKKLMTIPLLAAVALAIGLTVGVQRQISDYTRVIAKNWKLSLPRYAEELYECDDSGWTGDGDRYHILRYAQETAIHQAVGWQHGDSEKIREQVMEVIGTGTADGTGLAGLNVPKQWLPDFNRCRWFVMDGDEPGEHLWLLLDGDTLYAAERFI